MVARSRAVASTPPPPRTLRATRGVYYEIAAGWSTLWDGLLGQLSPVVVTTGCSDARTQATLRHFPSLASGRSGTRSRMSCALRVLAVLVVTAGAAVPDVRAAG